MLRSSCFILIACLYVSAAAQETLIGHGADSGEIRRAAEQIAIAQHQDGIESPGRVIVVYFTPKDRRPATGHPDRVRRIVQATASFYEQELARHGFPDRRLNILRSADGKIAIIDVIGEDIDKNYGKSDGGRIRKEIVPVLRAAKINPESSVLLIFCNLMDYDAKKSTISHHSPYYGGGNHLTGTCWQCDSEILDPHRLKDATPILDGEYGKITIGRHNSIFIGGVIHELGHALGLPHCKGRSDEVVRGTALMGSGNRTYGQELRGEGRGTFLTQAHALRLASHPAFNEMAAASLHDRPKTSWTELRVDVADDQTIRIQGRIEANIPVHGVVAYFDPEGRSNYDATTATAVPNASGEFAMRSGKLKQNLPGQLRLVTCHVNGADTQRAMSYRVDAGGNPDLTAIRVELELGQMVEALRRGDLDAAAAVLRGREVDRSLRQIGQRVLNRFTQTGKDSPASIEIDSIDESQRAIALSSIKPESANVGWIRPAYNRVPGNEVLLSVGGEYFASGIYAHAPAKHQYAVAGKWKKLTGTCGLQSGHPGKVDFEIRGDDRLLWRRRGVTEGDAHAYDVDISGVQTLTLLVTDGGNGGAADWGVWIEPTLNRD